MPSSELHAFKSFPDSEKEMIIQEGVKLYWASQKPNFSAIKKSLDTKYKTSICLGTLWNRVIGTHQDPRTSHATQQLLSPIQEKVLIEWIIHLSDTGHCISKRSVQKKAELICSQQPGQTWVCAFLSCHPRIVLGKPLGLDPKCAQAFNRPTVTHHLELLEVIIKKHNIPVENIYNMDEKGVQHGGGHKSQAQKYLIPHTKRPKYKLQSANLELVTIIECVAADGGSISPGIIFEGKQQYEKAWFEVDPKIS
jgi:Tc5 transposase-like DNA-binding protein